MSDSTLLATDNLESLKEGEIFTDPETGKKYRVKKAILPHYSASGPHGLGWFLSKSFLRITQRLYRCHTV